MDLHSIIVEHMKPAPQRLIVLMLAHEFVSMDIVSENVMLILIVLMMILCVHQMDIVNPMGMLYYIDIHYVYIYSVLYRCCNSEVCGDHCCCDEEVEGEEEEAQVGAVENDISDNSYDHETCTTAADCTNAGPRVCIGGLCYRECNEDDDCLHADFMCSPDGLCKPKGCVI